MAPASANKIAVLMLSLALVQSYPHMGQRASSSLSDERQGDGTTFAEVAGAAYAPSKPLVGSTTAFNFPTKKQIPVTRCAALAATIDRHTFWFNGKPPEDHAEGPIPTRKLPTRSTNLEALPISNQQDAETLFVGDIISMLCGGTQTSRRAPEAESSTSANALHASRRGAWPTLNRGGRRLPRQVFGARVVELVHHLVECHILPVHCAASRHGNDTNDELKRQTTQQAQQDKVASCAYLIRKRLRQMSQAATPQQFP